MSIFVPLVYFKLLNVYNVYVFNFQLPYIVIQLHIIVLTMPH